MEKKQHKNLIVNADDFGLAPHINKGIMEVVEKGAVNSVSVVANGDALDEAVDFIQKHPELKAGIHLTLIGEKPVSDCNIIPSLVTCDGFFYPDYKTFIRRYTKGEINPYEIRIELDAQIKTLVDKGLSLSHCDSHQHLHLLKKISYVTLRLCHTHRIKRIRIVNEGVFSGSLKHVIPLIAMNSFSYRIKKMARTYNIETTDRFLGFSTSMNINLNIIKKALHLSEQFSVELMCHPGVNVHDPGRYENWGMDWDRERKTILESLAGYFL
ncbi:MAG: ChbG/HpnK family deacetylase [Spirochaetales bacterium]|nr:ChbG/HpnK family deacetylase [Spirochaetales bacterium]